MSTKGRSELPDEDIEALRREIRSLATAVSRLAKSVAKDSDPSDPIQKLKVFLVDDARRIDLFDLITAQTHRTVEVIQNPENSVRNIPFSNEELNRRLDSYRAATTELTRSVAIGSYWGRGDQNRLWARAVEELANAIDPGNGLNVWLDLRLLPASMVMYASGVAGILGQNLDAPKRVLLEPHVKEVTRVVPAVQALAANSLIDPQLANAIPDLERHYTPGSDYIHELLRDEITQLTAASPEAYDVAFDQFEFLVGTTYLDSTVEEFASDNEEAGLLGHPRYWAPVGRFAWRGQRRERDDVALTLPAALEREGADWPPLRAGFFRGDVRRAQSVFAAYGHVITAARRGMW